MPGTLVDNSGDGVTVPKLQIQIVVPDAGTSFVVAGVVQQPGNPAVALTGSPMTSPGVPGSGTNYWIIQANWSTGALSVKTSTVAMPVPDAGNLLLYSDQIPAGASADPLVAGGDTTPDSW